MKKILSTGIITLLVVGIIVFLIKVAVIDFLPRLFGPLILFLFGEAYLNSVIPLSLIFTLLTAIVLGVIIHFLGPKINLRKLISKELKGKQGALYKNDVAAVIKDFELKNRNQKIEKRYVIYRPFSPVPWTGWLSFPKEEEVILLKISYIELYNIVASFGKNTPDLIEEFPDLIEEFIEEK